ncbi:hypothetical protein BC938DRAFT_474536 [Jimgerdemannia flammicorona]|uniref:Uncharacterized protein n=1 Tax=Jimgerdemannia flammicorona TaxID=994334 RepID=A0A433QSF5_9FUNG|nr:hypothetical protein BC938DRAFT_474536 [Jimgerdemannia flammicorona]
MTEEEQLNAAIAASLGDELTTEPKEHSPVILSDDEEDETMDDGVLLPPSPTPVLAPEPVVMSPFESIKPVKREEPTDLKTSTRIQIRLTGER